LVARITGKKRRLTLDGSMLITMEETMLDSKHSKVRKLLGSDMAISNATMDRARENECEDDYVRVELV